MLVYLYGMLIILGPTGAGKSSQAARLEQKYPIYKWIEIGGLLRESLDPKVKKTIEKGILISDDLVTTLVADAIHQIPSSKQPLLDGYPRSVGQAHGFSDVMARLERNIVNVIHITIQREIAEERLAKRARSDDTKATIARKWQVFKTETMPVIEAYAKSGLVAEINGDGSVEEVGQRIDKAINLN